MKLNKKAKRAAFVAALAFATIVGGACTDSDLDQQRRDSVNERTESQARAEALYPTPMNQNFPLRGLLIEYTKRCDAVNHPWYTYILSDTGQITHYFVSTTVPVSTNAFLGSTEVYKGDGTVLTAPSLDGIYYGGSGAITAANGWIFIDAATGAMGIAYGESILTFEAPLILETEPLLLTVAGK